MSARHVTYRRLSSFCERGSNHDWLQTGLGCRTMEMQGGTPSPNRAVGVPVNRTKQEGKNQCCDIGNLWVLKERQVVGIVKQRLRAAYVYGRGVLSLPLC